VGADFNTGRLKTFLLHFYRHISCTTRGHFNIHAGLMARATAFKERDVNMDAYKKARYDLR
jgi:hypothetical protein